MRKKYKKENKRLIANDGLDMHILASVKAKGASFSIVHLMYNAIERAPFNLPPIGTKAIYNAISKSNFIKKKRIKICVKNGKFQYTITGLRI